jgi:hypothetical protein
MSAPYPEQAIKFLRAIQPCGTWSLAVLPAVHTRFLPPEIDDLSTFLRSHTNADVYFRCGLARKCTGADGAMQDEDVTAVTCLWCDVDIPALKGITDMQERSRIKAGELARIHKVAGKLLPTIINDSGNGYHLYWFLQAPVKIGQDFTRLDLSIVLNGIAKWMGGDGKCRNPSRLLRLPGTWNCKLPALPLLCHTVEQHNENKYQISDFPKDNSFISRTPTAVAEINPAPAVDLGSLHISPDLRNKIETGIDTKTGLKWSDRSQLMNHIAVELIKAGVKQEETLSILMDPRFHHAGHVWDVREPLREARRTLNWALDAAQSEVDANDSTARLNANYFMVCLGGKIVYGHDDNVNQKAEMPREIMSVQDFKFETAYIKETYTGADGKEIKVDVFRKWIEDEKRRRFYPKGYVIDPTRSHADGYYNLWKGYAVSSQKGSWAKMQENLRCLCEGKQAYVDYVMNWIASMIQHPTILPRTAIVFHGGQGTGKSLFADALTRILGTHAMKITLPEQLTGRFSGHLWGKIFIQADECKFNDTNIGKLKSLVTDPIMPVERKGSQIVEAPNYCHFIITSNEDKVVPVDPSNRRFVIFKPLTTYQTTPHCDHSRFWRELVDEMTHGGDEAMLHDLLERDVTSWNPEAKPETVSMARHKLDTLSRGKLALKMWLESADPSPVSFMKMTERYKADAHEIDSLCRDLQIRLGAGTVTMPPVDEIRAAWLKIVGVALEGE